MNTHVWLIRFKDKDGRPEASVHTHNCIDDYRHLDPGATVQEIDCAAVAELIEAATRAEKKLTHLHAHYSGAEANGIYSVLRDVHIALARVGGAS